MNQFFHDNLITIIVFLVLLLFVMMGTMIFILFRLLTQPKTAPAAAPAVEPKEVKTAFNKFKFVEETVVEKYYCSHHPDTPSVGSCLICEEVFCEDCLIDHESMHFCKEHFRTFASNKWEQITDVRTTPETPEDGLYIYNFKKDLWLNKSIPTFVMTHYKINIENDYIESFIQLNVRVDDVAKLTHEIEAYKK